MFAGLRDASALAHKAVFFLERQFTAGFCSRLDYRNFSHDSSLLGAHHGIMSCRFSAIVSTPARVWGLVLIVYLLASFFSVTIKTYLPRPWDASVEYKPGHWAVMSLPRVLRGEEPHFLMVANSLAHDGDLRVSREYTAAWLGGPQMGEYFRGLGAEYFLQHFSRKMDFTLVSKHPPGLPMFFAMMLWPLADTSWMEAATVWLTAFIGALGVLVFIRVMEAMDFSWTATRNTALLLAFATPWFSYSRTLYSEVFVGTGYLMVLLTMLRGRWILALLLSAATAWIKYPALLLFAAVGCGELVDAGRGDGADDAAPTMPKRTPRWWPRRSARRLFLVSAAAGILVCASILGYNKWLYSDTSWVTFSPADIARLSSQPSSGRVLKRGILLRVGAPIAWVPGKVFSNVKDLFKDKDKGLFPHCPMLLFSVGGIIVMARRRECRRAVWMLLLCLVPWTVVHVCYRYFMTGESYTTRYLVPIVPLAMVGLPVFWQWTRQQPRPVWRSVATIAVSLSLLNNILAGFFPGLAFNRAPWEVWQGGYQILRAVLIG